MTREELLKTLDPLEKDIWAALKKNGAHYTIPDHAVEEFVIYAVLGIKPTWET